MGQFKPMVKMMTTEPSVELKLKKGGHVSMKSGKGDHGHKKMADGGMPMMPARGAAAPAAAPQRPSLMARRRAMRGLPAGAGPAAPVGQAARMMSGAAPAMPPQGMPPQGMPPQGMPTMKKGGDTMQDKAMIKKAMKQHDAQEHKGGKGTKLSLKHGGKMATGGVVNGQGGFATGGVVNGQGGFKTGGVANANGGGYRKGGAPKKAYAAGGTVNSGRPVAMPQGSKKPSPPVSTNRVSGTFKRGGKVGDKRMGGGGRAVRAAGNMFDGVEAMTGQGRITEAERRVALKKPFGNMENETNGMGKELSGKIRDYLQGQGATTDAERKAMHKAMPEGNVTETKEEFTVTPAKKRGGRVC